MLMRNRQPNQMYLTRLAIICISMTNSDTCALGFPVSPCQIISSDRNTHKHKTMRNQSIMKVVFVTGKSHLTLTSVQQFKIQKPP